MYELAYFRNNLDAIATRLADRGFTVDVEAFRKLDAERRAAVSEAEGLKAQKNTESAEIGKLKRAGEDTATLQQRVRELDELIAKLDGQASELDAKFREIMAGIPNTPHESVPVGKSSAENAEIKRWGTPPEFSFKPKAHWDLGPELGILDFERAAKITGARFAVYMGLGAKLERALINFMLDVHTKEHGYTEVLPPFMINSASLFGTGQLPKFAADLFKLENTDYWLAPTAEVPVTNLFRDETLEAWITAAHQVLRLHAVLPQRGGIVWARCARDHPAASVPESRAGEIRAAGQQLRRTRRADERCREHSRKAGVAVPARGVVHGRCGVQLGQDVRSRGVAARAERVQGNFVVLEF